jgi:putative tryptophan/tyrosine transport system substrate-binding protein
LRHEAKRLGLLRELVPSAARIAVIVNPNSPELDSKLSDLQTGAGAIGWELQILRVGSEAELDAAFATLGQSAVQALLVAADPFFNSQRERIVALAARHKIPAIYEARGYVIFGGLMSYVSEINIGDLAACCERPRRGTAEQRDELALFTR